jgi:hypothetical protein
MLSIPKFHIILSCTPIIPPVLPPRSAGRSAVAFSRIAPHAIKARAAEESRFISQLMRDAAADAAPDPCRHLSLRRLVRATPLRGVCRNCRNCRNPSGDFFSRGRPRAADFRTLGGWQSETQVESLDISINSLLSYLSIYNFSNFAAYPCDSCDTCDKLLEMSVVPSVARSLGILADYHPALQTLAIWQNRPLLPSEWQAGGVFPRVRSRTSACSSARYILRYQVRPQSCAPVSEARATLKGEWK